MIPICNRKERISFISINQAHNLCRLKKVDFKCGNSCGKIKIILSAEISGRKIRVYLSAQNSGFLVRKFRVLFSAEFTDLWCGSFGCGNYECGNFECGNSKCGKFGTPCR